MRVILDEERNKVFRLRFLASHAVARDVAAAFHNNSSEKTPYSFIMKRLLLAYLILFFCRDAADKNVVSYFLSNRWVIK